VIKDLLKHVSSQLIKWLHKKTLFLRQKYIFMDLMRLYCILRPAGKQFRCK